MEKSEWRHAPIDGPMPGHEIGSHGDYPGARGGRDLYIWTGRHVRVSGSSGDGLSILRDPREPHKRTRWNDTKLVSASGAEGTNEQHGALREGEESGVGRVQFPWTTAMPDGRQARGPHRNLPKFWNLNPLTANGQEILRIPTWTKSFELVKKGARDDIGERSPTNEHSRVPHSEENDPGDEQFPGCPVPLRENHNRRTAEGVYRRLGSALHRLHCSDLFPYQRCEDKLMDDSSQENERVDAPEIRSAKCLEST